jgi:hypothetical protein
MTASHARGLAYRVSGFIQDCVGVLQHLPTVFLRYNGLFNCCVYWLKKLLNHIQTWQNTPLTRIEGG